MPSKSLALMMLWAVPWSALAAQKTAPPKDAATEVRAQTPRAKREIVLDEKDESKVIAIYTARNVLTTVEFPDELVAQPRCGSCEADEGAPGAAPYRLGYSIQGRYLTVRPNPEVRQGNEDISNILVRLEHATLTLVLIPGEVAKADTRVVLGYPNRVAESEYLRVERGKIEAEANERVEKMYRNRLHQAMLEPHACRSTTTRNRNDDIVLEMREMCFFGRDVFFTFQLENRGSTPFETGAVTVDKGVSDGQEESRTVKSDRPEVGVVGVHLRDSEQLHGPYTLTVREAGGKERTISVNRLEF